MGLVKLSHMDSQTARALLDRWYKALNTRQFKELGALLAEIADAEIVTEYPQSGERIKGRENNLAVVENYPVSPTPRSRPCMVRRTSGCSPLPGRHCE